jgi:hypothetical protein
MLLLLEDNIYHIVVINLITTILIATKQAHKPHLMREKNFLASFIFKGKR